MSIGENIKKYRNLLGLTQKELGEKIGKTTSSVRKYEADQTEIPRSVLNKISDVLDIHIDYLLYATFEEWIASLPFDIQENIITMLPEDYYKMEFDFKKNLAEFDSNLLELKDLEGKEKGIYENCVKEIGGILNSMLSYIQISVTLKHKVHLEHKTLQELKRYVLSNDMTKQELIENVSPKDREIIVHLDESIFDTLEKIKQESKLNKKDSNFNIELLDDIQKYDELPQQAIDEINSFIEFIRTKYKDENTDKTK